MWGGGRKLFFLHFLDFLDLFCYVLDTNLRFVIFQRNLGPSTILGLWSL